MVMETGNPRVKCHDCGLRVDSTIYYKGKMRCDDCIVKYDERTELNDENYLQLLKKHYHNSSGCQQWYQNEYFKGASNA